MTIKPDSTIASPIQIEALLIQLEDWQSQLQQGQIKQRLHMGTAPKIDPHLRKDFDRLHIESDLATAEAVGTVVTAIKAWLKQAPIVHLTFPVPVAGATQIAIIDWFHTHINPSMLVTFMVDGGIAAGFTLRTRNHIFNFTANQVLWRSRHYIAELVQHV